MASRKRTASETTEGQNKSKKRRVTGPGKKGKSKRSSASRSQATVTESSAASAVSGTSTLTAGGKKKGKTRRPRSKKNDPEPDYTELIKKKIKRRKAKNTPNSCDRCQMRRIKCDNQRPACAPCALAAQVCRTTDGTLMETTRRAQPSQAQLIVDNESLKDRIKRLETETFNLRRQGAQIPYLQAERSRYRAMYGELLNTNPTMAPPPAPQDSLFQSWAQPPQPRQQDSPSLSPGMGLTRRRSESDMMSISMDSPRTQNNLANNINDQTQVGTLGGEAWMQEEFEWARPPPARTLPALGPNDIGYTGPEAPTPIRAPVTDFPSQPTRSFARRSNYRNSTSNRARTNEFIDLSLLNRWTQGIKRHNQDPGAHPPQQQEGYDMTEGTIDPTLLEKSDFDDMSL